MPTKDMYRYLAIKHATQRELESDKETETQRQRERETKQRTESTRLWNRYRELNETGYGQAQTGTDRHGQAQGKQSAKVQSVLGWKRFLRVLLFIRFQWTRQMLQVQRQNKYKQLIKMLPSIHEIQIQLVPVLVTFKRIFSTVMGYAVRNNHYIYFSVSHYVSYKDNFPQRCFQFSHFPSLFSFDSSIDPPLHCNCKPFVSNLLYLYG